MGAVPLGWRRRLQATSPHLPEGPTPSGRGRPEIAPRLAESRLASASKDGTVRLWERVGGRCAGTLCGHANSVTCLRWGGEGLLYSGSQDRTVKVWAPDESKLVRPRRRRRGMRGRGMRGSPLESLAPPPLATGALARGARPLG